MQNSKKPYFQYDPPPKTHFLAKIAFGLIAILIVVAIIGLVKDKRNQAGNIRPAEAGASREVNTGQSLHTRYFDIIVSKVFVSEKIADRSASVNLSKEEGKQYLVIEITLKNTDAESKMMPDGKLQIESGGKELEFENSETLIKEGWGVMMENIEPGITIKTKLVYKIPDGVSGKAYYFPDILYNEDRIFLMNL
jgi:hypothetical protein